MQQSLVDTVVFNRDIDFSGDSAFDPEFQQNFIGAAGKGSWKQKPDTEAGLRAYPEGIDSMPGLPQRPQAHRLGLRTYESAPTYQSLVDNIVFNRDIDFSGESVFDEPFMRIFKDGAGKPSWHEPPPQCKRPFSGEPGKRRPGELPPSGPGSVQHQALTARGRLQSMRRH